MSKEYIRRPIYIERIKPFIGKDIIKVLVGQRRVGKSYLLLQLMDEVRAIDPDAVIISINMEEYRYRSIRTWEDLHEYVASERGSAGFAYIFIDEIQEIEDFERALRSFMSEGFYDIYCTGSNAWMMSGELATLLSGRYVEINVYPLNYIEFLEFNSLTETEESFRNYLLYGGMPWLTHTDLRDEIVFEYLKNLTNSIILKDVVERHRIRNVSVLKNLVQFLADNTGSLVSSKRISDYLKSQRIDISVRIVIEYLNYLTDSMLVARVKRSVVGGRKIFEVGEKYYFNDHGIRNAIIPFRQTDINKLLENMVMTHLVSCGYSVTVGQMDQKEIDFIAERRSEKVYFQVAYLIGDKRTQEREFGNLLSIDDNWPKYVVSSDTLTGGSYEGIRHINIRQFLTRMDY